jgi:hypothetical protein
MVRKLLHRESGSAMDRFIYHDWLMGSLDALTPKEGARSQAQSEAAYS